MHTLLSMQNHGVLAQLLHETWIFTRWKGIAWGTQGRARAGPPEAHCSRAWGPPAPGCLPGWPGPAAPASAGPAPVPAARTAPRWPPAGAPPPPHARTAPAPAAAHSRTGCTFKLTGLFVCHRWAAHVRLARQQLQPAGRHCLQACLLVQQAAPLQLVHRELRQDGRRSGMCDLICWLDIRGSMCVRNVIVAVYDEQAHAAAGCCRAHSSDGGPLPRQHSGCGYGAGLARHTCVGGSYAIASKLLRRSLKASLLQCA